MIKFTPRVSLTRASNNMWYFNVTDHTSCSQILEIKMTNEEFAGLMAHMCTMLGKDSAELINYDRINKIKLTKTINVPAPEHMYDCAAIEKYVNDLIPSLPETEGWTYDSYSPNRQGFRKNNTFVLTFFKYVIPAEQK